MKNAPLSFLLTDENNQPLGEATTFKNKPGNYEMQGELPENVTCICFIPVYSDGSRGEELFNIAW